MVVSNLRDAIDIRHHWRICDRVQSIAQCLQVFFSIAGRQWITPQVLELDADGCSDVIVGREEPEAWGLGDLDRLWLQPSV